MHVFHRIFVRFEDHKTQRTYPDPVIIGLSNVRLKDAPTNVLRNTRTLRAHNAGSLPWAV